MGDKGAEVRLAAVLAVVGAVVGYVIAAPESVRRIQPWLAVVLGAAAGGLSLPAYEWMRSAARGVRLESVPVTLPFLGKLEFKFTDDQRRAGWRIFVETATRTTTQPLDPGAGSLQAALKSLHSLFDMIRGELKQMPPSPPPGQGETTVESFAIRMLNDALRPCLTRWHPRLDDWAEQKLPESLWPFAELCRSDLEVTRKRVLVYAWGLGEMLRVADLDRILPAQVAVRPSLAGEGAIRAIEQGLPRPVPKAQASAAWRIFVEASSRIATQPLGPGDGRLREALTSLCGLFSLVRDELGKAGPTPGTVPPGEERLEVVALRLLNARLRPFLARWHPRLQDWEAGKQPEDQWPLNVQCRADLEGLRQASLDDVRRLGELAGLRDAAAILPPHAAPA